MQQRLWQQQSHLQIALCGAKHNSMWVAHADTGDQPVLACHLQRRLYRCAALHHYHSWKKRKRTEKHTLLGVIRRATVPRSSPKGPQLIQRQETHNTLSQCYQEQCQPCTYKKGHQHASDKHVQRAQWRKFHDDMQMSSKINGRSSVGKQLSQSECQCMDATM